MKMLFFSMITVLSLILILTGCSNNSSPTAPKTPTPKTVDVTIVDSAFQPQVITINVNDTVRWTNNGVRTHSSTSGTNGTPDGIWDSGDITPGNTFTRQFTEVGTFDYFCKYHWQMGMTGQVKVVQP